MSAWLKQYWLYFPLGLALVVVFFLARLPAAAVAERVGAEVARASRGAWDIEFRQPSIVWLSGLRAEELRLRNTQKMAEPISLGASSARLRLLPLLLGNVRVSVDLRPASGRVYGVVGVNDSAAQSSLRGEGLRVEKVMRILEAVGSSSPSLEAISPTGLFEFETDGLRIEQADFGQSTGSVRIGLRGGSLGPGDLSGFGLPQVTLGDLNATLRFDKGRYEITEFDLSGGDLEAKLSLQGALGKIPSRTSIKMCAQLKATDAFLAREPKMKSVLQLAEVRLKKDSNGFLSIPVDGSFAKPQPRLGRVCSAAKK